MMRMICIAGAFILGQAFAQTIPYDDTYKFGTLMPFANRWGGPVALDLARTAGGGGGHVWLRETAEGILIFSHLSGEEPAYAGIPLQMHTHDHVSLWLTAAQKIGMPEIGWGNQFGLTNCKELLKQEPERSAEDCQAWENQQVRYREQLRRLFVRHWELTPTASVESYASRAYLEVLDYLTDSERAAFSELEPHGRPLMAAAKSTGFSYFEIFVPWSVFPPVNSLDFSRIYVAVEFCNAAGACSSTAPARKEDDPATWNQLDLERPKVASLTACGYPLEVSDLFQNRYPAWYFPDDAGHLSDVLALETEAKGYRYAPTGVSPIPTWKHHFSKRISNTEVVCGPDPRYVAGKKTYTVQGSLDESHLEIRSLPNGAHLLKSGPTVGILSPFGAGQCGSCTTVALTISYLSPETGITVAFDEQVVMDRISDVDIRTSPDWKTVTVYSAETDVSPGKNAKDQWSSKRYCLSGSRYEQCGGGPASAPPEPRQVLLSGQDR